MYYFGGNINDEERCLYGDVNVKRIFGFSFYFWWEFEVVLKYKICFFYMSIRIYMYSIYIYVCLHLCIDVYVNNKFMM